MYYMTRISKQGTTSVNIISAVKGHWTYDEGCKGLQRVAIGNIAIFAWRRLLVPYTVKPVLCDLPREH